MKSSVTSICVTAPSADWLIYWERLKLNIVVLKWHKVCTAITSNQLHCHEGTKHQPLNPQSYTAYTPLELQWLNNKF